MSLFKSIRSLLINVSLFLFASALVYLATEYAFLRVFTRLFPLPLVQKFEEPDGIWPLLQSSKRGFYPENYIALAGDSYAMGMGDAMDDELTKPRHPSFHSAHVIQEKTGRDVLSFGRPGSGSIRGAISNPVAGLHYLQKLVDKSFPAPQWMVLYFYEGNDLTENWIYYKSTFLPDHAPAEYENLAIFDDYIQRFAVARAHLYLAAEAATWKDRLFFWRFFSRIFAESVQGKQLDRKKYPNEFSQGYLPRSIWAPRVRNASVNHALIGGQVVPLPDNLQGPSMDLSPDQLQHAIGTFSKALNWSRAHFSQTRFAVVYIPSVLATYSLVGEEADAQNYFSDHTRVATAALEARHVWIREQIEKVCREQDVPFVDATPDLREAASVEKLHGPKDWNHLSGKGYKVLGESVVRQLPALH